MSPHLRARIRNNQTWTAGRLAVTAYAVRRRRKSPDRIIRIAVTGDGPALELRSSHALRLVNEIVDQLETLDTTNLDN